MAKAQFQPYAVISGGGRQRDPLPKIGTGFRLVRAKIGNKWVHLRTYHENEPAGRIRLNAWRDRVSKTPFEGQPMGALLRELRP